MAITAETLQVVITGSMQGLASAYTAAGKATEKFTAGVGARLGQVRSGMNAVGSAALKLAAPIAAAGAAFLSFKTVMDSLNRADGLARTSAELGVTTDALQRLGHAAKLSGSNITEVQDAMRFMSRFLGQASEAGSQAAKTMQKLGLSIDQFAGMSADEAFMAMSDALNGITDQGMRANVMQEVFGRGARNIALMVANGSEKMRALGDEAERTGKVLSAFELGELVAAKGAIEELQATFAALGDRLAKAFAPVIAWLSKAINDWIGDARSFDSTMSVVADGFVRAVGVMRLAWQGLQLMWEQGKVVIGALSVGVYEAARGITKAFMWVSDVVGDTWDWIKASFQVTADAIVVGWEWVKSKAIIVFASIGEAFARQMMSIGAAARESGIKGLSDIGWQAETAGADLLVGAMKLKQGAEAGLIAAKDNLDRSIQQLEAAREELAAPTDLSTPILDQMTDQAHAFFAEAKKGFADLAQAIADQEGGNAYENTLINFRNAQERMQEEALKSAEAFQQRRNILAEQGAANEQAIEEQRGFWLLEYTQMLQDNVAMIVQDAEFKKAEYIRNFVQQHEEQMFDERMKWAAMWESGMESKLQVIGSMISGFASLMQSNNKKMFEIGKVAAIAETIINTYLGAQLAFVRGMELGGPIVATIAAASALAGGLMRVQQIASTQFGTKSASSATAGPGVPSGATSAREEAKASSQSNVNVTLYGSTFSADAVRGLVGAINDQVGDNLNLKAQVA